PANYPRESHIQVDIGAAIGRQPPGDLSLDEPKAVELAHMRVTQKPPEYPLGDNAEGVADPAMRWLIRRPGVNNLDLVRRSNVEQSSNVARLSLTVFVQRDHPVSVRARHPCKGCCMLAEVARKPDRSDKRHLGGQ